MSLKVAKCITSAFILTCCWPGLQPDLTPVDTMPWAEENSFRLCFQCDKVRQTHGQSITRDQRANGKCELRARADERGRWCLLALALTSPVLGAIFSMPWPHLEAKGAILLFNSTV